MVTGGERDDMTSYNTAMEDRALGNLLLKAKPKGRVRCRHRRSRHARVGVLLH